MPAKLLLLLLLLHAPPCADTAVAFPAASLADVRCDAAPCVTLRAPPHQAFPLAGRDDAARTTSIDVAELVVPPRMGDALPTATLSVWDFAGDDVCYATHSLFLASEVRPPLACARA